MTKIFGKITKAASLVAMLSGPVVFAGDLPVVDPSFESPALGPNGYTYGGAGSSAIPGWTISGPGSAGVWNVNGDGAYIAAPPNGSQVGFIDGAGGVTTVSQILTGDLQARSTYTLQISVSEPANAPGLGNVGSAYSVGLYAGGTLLTSITPEALVAGSWTTLSATYTTGSVVPAGEPLEIEISARANQLDFDQAIVDPDPVPDGGTTAMLLGLSMAGLGWIRRKI